MPNTPPSQRRSPVVESTDWTLAELGRSITTLAVDVRDLTRTLGQLGQTVVEQGSRLRVVERLAYGTAGAGVTLVTGALLSGHIHLQ